MKTPLKKKPATKTPKAKPAVKDIAKGWACPCCPRVYAPTVTECTCRQEAMGKKIQDANEHARQLREFAERLKEIREGLRPRQEPWQWPPLPLQYIPNPNYPFGEPVMCKTKLAYRSF